MSLRTCAALFALAVILQPATAIAVPVSGPVPNHAIVGGTDLFGMEPSDARAVIANATSSPSVQRILLTDNGARLVLRTRGLLKVDADSMLASAYASRATTAPFELASRFRVRSEIIARQVTRLARAADRAPIDAAWRFNGNRVIPTRSVPGWRTDQRGATRAIAAAIVTAASQGASPQPLALPGADVAPRVPNSSLPRVLLVDISERKLYLYKAGSIEKTFGVAVGTPGFPTPKGTFVIEGKVSMPTWRNPGSDWAKDMPAVIGPGPSNPLGTRALYVSSPGIRIHGTSKDYSIGTAASHGCMRMHRSDIEELYPLIPVGTRLYIVK